MTNFREIGLQKILQNLGVTEEKLNFVGRVYSIGELPQFESIRQINMSHYVLQSKKQISVGEVGDLLNKFNFSQEVKELRTLEHWGYILLRLKDNKSSSTFYDYQIDFVQPDFEYCPDGEIRKKNRWNGVDVEEMGLMFPRN
ncbi:MAG: hypothetical protein AABX93_02760 [Nanoarchaeota archaeon]